MTTTENELIRANKVMGRVRKGDERIYTLDEALELLKAERKETKDLKKLRKEALQFSANVYRFISWLDEEMKKPSAEERGRRVARALKEFKLCADLFAHFELHQSFEKISKMKKAKP